MGDPFANGGQNGSWNRGRDLWLPPGRWQDAFSGEVLQGNVTIARKSVPIDSLPLYHRLGGLVVLAGATKNSFILETWPLSDWPSPQTVRSVTGVAMVAAAHGPTPSVHIECLQCAEISWLVRFHLDAEKSSHVPAVFVNGVEFGSGGCNQHGTAPCALVLTAAGSTTPFGGGGVRPAAGTVVEVYLPASHTSQSV